METIRKGFDFRGTLLLVGIILGLASCETQDPAANLSVSFTSDVVCKGGSPLKSGDPPPETACIRYEYAGDSLLTLHQLNASFNCCPEDFAVNIEVKGDSLIIREDDVKQGCKCNCLYDIDILLHNLPADVYHVRIIEANQSAEWERLSFTIDLDKKPSGEYCVNRQVGWWR
jgi:hypothetical protein